MASASANPLFLVMSKRLRTAEPSASAHKSKRQKSNFVIGAPSADDLRLPSETISSSSALSVRNLRQPFPHSLVSICIRVFSEHFQEFCDENRWESTKKWLEIVPDAVLPRLFTALKMRHPGRLNHAVITTYFLRGVSVVLDGNLGVTSVTLSAIPRVLGNRLRVLELSDFKKFSDRDYSSMIKRLPSLETLILRNCTKVGPSTVEAAAETCPNLKIVNLSFTSATALSLLPLIKACPDLEVLKLAGIQNLSDATVTKLLTVLSSDSRREGCLPLKRLKSLKLRHNTLSDVAILQLLHHCPVLERLDVSFTLLRHLSGLPHAPPIEKLSLTSTFIPGKELIELVGALPHLRILNIGAMGVKPGTNTAIMNSTAMTLNDDVLRLLTDALRNCSSLESINLVQNSKIGSTRRHDSALAYFIRQVGRRCQHLNLSGVPMRSEDLIGLVAEDPEDPVSPLKTLNLNKTLIDDECTPWISSCASLEILEAAETKISGTSSHYRLLSSLVQSQSHWVQGCENR
ncbi:RNI-like protein [Phellopilus nigrolimitatus]|nr:RNI-like protein [Phellopilus nigrolimitatus]